MKRALLLLALVVACQASPAPAASTTPGPDRVPRGGVPALADYEFPDTLDPIHATTLSDLRVAAMLFEPLWTLGPDLAPVPRLLRQVPSPANGGVKLGRDGVSMTIDLRLAPGLRWSDGAPLTADDVIFTVDAICSAALPGRDRTGFDHIASQEKRSPTEVVWHLGPRPKGACGLPADLASGVFPAYPILGPRAALLPSHRLAAIPETAWPADGFFQHPDVVSGPFRFESSVPGSLIELAANPAYAQGRPGGPRLDGVTWRYYEGKEAMIAGLQVGEADAGFHLQPADRAELAGVKRSRTLVSPSLQGEFLVPNHAVNAATGRPPPWVGDQPVLAALTEALDRAALDQAAFAGEASITPGLFPAILEPLAGKGVAAAPAVGAAKALLDSDGWAVGAGGVRVKAGRRLQFELLTICDSAPRQVEQAELIRQWSLVGAEVSAACAPRATFLAANGVAANGRFDMGLYSNTWDPDPSAWAAFAKGPLDWGRCEQPSLDRYFEAGAATLDPARRRAAYSAAAEEWLRDGCSIPLYEWPSVVQVSARLNGFQPDPRLGLDIGNAAGWWLSSA